MECSSGQLLDCCLFFTASSLARVITRIGEEEFSKVGLTPSGAFLLMLASEDPGILQKDLAEKLHLAQSTVSRLVDSMVRSGHVRKEGQGRHTHIHPTPAGLELFPAIRAAWSGLRDRYNLVLGESEGDDLARRTAEAFKKLDG